MIVGITRTSSGILTNGYNHDAKQKKALPGDMRHDAFGQRFGMQTMLEKQNTFGLFTLHLTKNKDLVTMGITQKTCFMT